MTNFISKHRGQDYSLQPPLGTYFRMKKSLMRLTTKVDSLRKKYANTVLRTP